MTKNKSKKSSKNKSSKKISKKTSPPAVDDDFDVALDELLDSYVAGGGAEAYPSEYDCVADPRYCTTTGSPHLDYVLGGGIYSGRMYEIYGEPHHGKSTLAQNCMVGCQQSGGLTVLIDTEITWNRKRAKKMGYNFKRHFHVYPDYLEEVYACIEDLAHILRGKDHQINDKLSKSLNVDAMKRVAEGMAERPILFVLDTLAAAPSYNAYLHPEKRYGGGMAERARINHDGMRSITMPLAKLDVGLLLVNQTIAKLGTFRTGITTPGGGGPKFYTSARISVRKAEDFVIQGLGQVGFLSKVNAIKCRFAPPFRPVKVPLRFTSGIDKAYDLLYWLMLDEAKFSAIYESGGSGNYRFSLDGQEYGFRGKNNFESFYTEHPEFLMLLEMEVMKIAMDTSFDAQMKEQELGEYEDYIEDIED